MSGICLSTCFVFSKTYPSFLTVKEGFFESLRLPFQRELHLFPQAPSSSEGGGCNRSYSELEPLRYKVGGPSEVCASFLCGMGPHGHGAADGLFETALDTELLLDCLRLHDICHQRSAPVFLCGMGPHGHGVADFS